MQLNDIHFFLSESESLLLLDDDEELLDLAAASSFWTSAPALLTALAEVLATLASSFLEVASVLTI
jgi:hypothetical protein